jgi:hypothetical protein
VGTGNLFDQCLGVDMGLRRQPLNVLKFKAHILLDQLWKKPPYGYGLMSRSLAYRNVGTWLKKDIRESHISSLTKKECIYLINTLKSYGVKYHNDRLKYYAKKIDKKREKV